MNTNVDASFCASCSNEIVDRFMYNIIGCFWHAECVRCCICQKALTEKCYTKSQRLYCKEDYFRRHGFDCAGCHQAIHSSDYVRKVNNQSVYHIGCLVCYRCGRSLSTGEDLYIVSTNDFTDQLICKEDYLDMQATCQSLDGNSRTTNSITDSVVSNRRDGVSSIDSQQQSLHYSQQSEIQPANMVDHHPPVYQSSSSMLSLSNDANNTTDTYQQCSTPFIDCINPIVSHDSKSFDNCTTSVANSPSKLDSTLESEESECSETNRQSNLMDSAMCSNFDFVNDSSIDRHDPNQIKRVPRTAIKNDQLQVLSDAFLTCQKPSKKLGESLANQTGLSTRVIQVWFQNRRSKQRRSYHADTKSSHSDSHRFESNSSNILDSEYFSSPRASDDHFLE